MENGVLDDKSNTEKQAGKEEERKDSNLVENISKPQELVEQPLPAELEKHAFSGEINARNGAGGYHHREGGVDSGNSKIIESTKTPPDAHGVYQARFTMTRPDGTTTNPKFSTFFPDSYTKSDVRASVREAFENRTEGAESDQWVGTSNAGIKIAGFLKNGASSADATESDIATFYPIDQNDMK